MALRRAINIRALQSIVARQPAVRPTLAQASTTPLYRLESKQPRPAFVSVRWHTAPSGGPRVLDYDEIKRLSEEASPERILIDVREPSEYAEGYIPGAINIPVKSQPDAIFLPEEEFEDRFGFSKPTKEQELIFYCRAGVRSSAASQLAQQEGYPNILDYRGSWLDWQKNGGPISKP